MQCGRCCHHCPPRILFMRLLLCNVELLEAILVNTCMVIYNYCGWGHAQDSIALVGRQDNHTKHSVRGLSDSFKTLLYKRSHSISLVYTSWSNDGSDYSRFSACL